VFTHKIFVGNFCFPLCLDKFLLLASQLQQTEQKKRQRFRKKMKAEKQREGMMSTEAVVL
jgi:hypothetical protein